MNQTQKKLRELILNISFKKKYSHLGSCLTAVDPIAAIYAIKKKDEEFVLSNGHAALAWYCVLHLHGILSRRDIETLYVHPDRNVRKGISVSTGSLGHGLPIALGMALSDRKKRIFCMISDGECMEGSVWESLRIIKEQNVLNLTVLVNANGWGAYRAIDVAALTKQLRGVGLQIVHVRSRSMKIIQRALAHTRTQPTVIMYHSRSDEFPFLKGLDAHYYTLTRQDVLVALRVLGITT